MTDSPGQREFCVIGCSMPPNFTYQAAQIEHLQEFRDLIYEEILKKAPGAADGLKLNPTIPKTRGSEPYWSSELDRQRRDEVEALLVASNPALSLIGQPLHGSCSPGDACWTSDRSYALGLKDSAGVVHPWLCHDVVERYAQNNAIDPTSRALLAAMPICATYRYSIPLQFRSQVTADSQLT